MSMANLLGQRSCTASAGLTSKHKYTMFGKSSRASFWLLVNNTADNDFLRQIAKNTFKWNYWNWKLFQPMLIDIKFHLR